MEVKSLQELEGLVVNAINNNDVYSVGTADDEDKFIVTIYGKDNYEIESHHINKSNVIGEKDLWLKLAHLSESIRDAFYGKRLIFIDDNLSSDDSDRGGLKYL